MSLMQREDKARAGSAEAGDKRGDTWPPGLLPATGIALLAGLGMWAGLSRGLAAASNAAGTAGPSDIAQVNETEITGAIGSMAVGNADTGELAKKRNACSLHLAWVSLVLAPNQPRTTVRLESGRYVSPIFSVTEVPQRVAVPYPAPYEVGRGALILRKSGGALDVALAPAWHVAASQTEATQEVSWHPVAGCAPGRAPP